MKSALIIIFGCFVFSFYSQLEKTILKELIIDNSHHFNNKNQAWYKEIEGYEYNTYPEKEYKYDSRIILRKVSSKNVLASRATEDDDNNAIRFPAPDVYITVTFPDFKNDSYCGGVIALWKTPIILDCDLEKRDLEKRFEKILDIMQGYDDKSSQYYRKKIVQLDCDENEKICSEIRDKNFYWKTKKLIHLPEVHECEMETILNQKEIKKILKWLKKNKLEVCTDRDSDVIGP